MPTPKNGEDLRLERRPFATDAPWQQVEDGALLAARVLAAAGYEIAVVDLMVPEMERTAVEIHDAGCQVMMFEAQAALTTAALPRRITVAEMTIPLELPKDEAKALASMVHRLNLDDAAKFSNRTKYNDGRREQDVLWSAICMLERQLAEAGM